MPASALTGATPLVPGGQRGGDDRQRTGHRVHAHLPAPGARHRAPGGGCAPGCLGRRRPASRNSLRCAARPARRAPGAHGHHARPGGRPGTARLGARCCERTPGPAPVRCDLGTDVPCPGNGDRRAHPGSGRPAARVRRQLHRSERRAGGRHSARSRRRERASPWVLPRPVPGQRRIMPDLRCGAALAPYSAHRAARKEQRAGYRDVLAHLGLRLVLVASLILAFTGYPAFDSGLPAYASVEAHVSARSWPYRSPSTRPSSCSPSCSCCASSGEPGEAAPLPSAG